MWCLETIVAVNEKLAQGHTLDEAYSECGVVVPGRRRLPRKAEASSFPLREQALKEIEAALSDEDEDDAAREEADVREGTATNS